MDVKETKITDFSNISMDEFKQLLKGNIEIPLLKERYKTPSGAWDFWLKQKPYHWY